MEIGGPYHSVPVQLPNVALLQMLLSPGDVMTLGKILNELFSGPATRKESCLGARETPLDIGDEAVVGARGTEVIRILKIQGLVGSACREVVSMNATHDKWNE